MKVDSKNIKEEIGSGSNGLHLKITQLQNQLREEEERYAALQSSSDIAKRVACQELERFGRECSSLKEKINRLEEDCRVLRERQAEDKEMIKGLLVEIERKVRDFKEKVGELQTAKSKAEEKVEFWIKKYRDLERRVPSLVDEKSNVVGKGQSFDIDDGLPKRSDEENVEMVAENVKMEEKSFERNQSSKNVIDIDEDLTKKVAENVKMEEKSFERNQSSKNVIDIDEDLTKKADDSKEKGLDADSGLRVGREQKRVLVIDSDSEEECEDIDYDDNDDKIPLNKLTKKRIVEVSDGDASFKQTSGFMEVSGEHSVPKRQYEDAQVSSSPVNYKKEVADSKFISNRRRCYDTNLKTYTGRAYTGRNASNEQIRCAQRRAETLVTNLKSFYPTFIKSMTRSHVSSCFWLQLPANFCKENLLYCNTVMILEDEKAFEQKVKYHGSRTSLVGGWKYFAVEHNLEIGDALVFELRATTRFKVYIVKAHQDDLSEDFDDKIGEEDVDLMMPPNGKL